MSKSDRKTDPNVVVPSGQSKQASFTIVNGGVGVRVLSRLRRRTFMGWVPGVGFAGQGIPPQSQANQEPKPDQTTEETGSEGTGKS